MHSILHAQSGAEKYGTIVGKPLMDVTRATPTPDSPWTPISAAESLPHGAPLGKMDHWPNDGRISTASHARA